MVRVQLYVLFGQPLGRWLARQPFLRNYQLSLSRRAQLKMDAPESKARIQAYIDAYGIDTSVLTQPLRQFATLNQFFYRHINMQMRPLASPEDPSVLSSPADCRLLVFHSVSDAKKWWIKGAQFGVKQLLGFAPDTAVPYANTCNAVIRHLLPDKRDGPSVLLCRMAPTDYHRFHAPCDGVIGESWLVGSDLYSVKPVRATFPL